MSELLRRLREPMFARLFGATLMSDIRFWFQGVTFGWLAASLTKSPWLPITKASRARR